MIKGRRLQFFVRINSGLPPTFVDRFTAPGRYSFEAAFAPRARRYRRTNRIGVGLLVGFGVGLLSAVNLPVSDSSQLWIALPSALLLPLAVLVHLINLRLRCPSCRRALTPAKGRYCPQCGSEEYLAGSGRCEDCGGLIKEASGDDARSYRVRGCTHCGVFLEQQGL